MTASTKKFIAVAGNVGVGKSSLTRLLAEHFGWQPFYEAVDDNPYLTDFYRDMRTWAFHSQIFFLARRLHHHKQLLLYPSSVVQDRSVYEDAEIFARNLYRQGSIDERDYATYHDLYQTMIELVPPPDVVLYLRASVETLIERIRMRGRDYEQDIDIDYLRQLNELYEEWIQAFTLSPVLIVPADELDFVSHDTHFRLIAQKVEQKLSGKDEVTFGTDELDKVNGRTHD